MKALSFFISILFSCTLFSQSSCPNLDFENGNFTGWTGTVGCKPRGTTDFDIHYGNECDVATKQTLDLPIALTLNNLNGQQSLIRNNWNGGVDPYVPALSLTSPLGGNFVARIGDYYSGGFVGENGGRVGEISYSLTVDSANALLTAYYAIVLEAPGTGHTSQQNPYFKIRLLDPNGVSVPCVEYFQDGVLGAEGFAGYNCGAPCRSSADGHTVDKSVMVWRDWTAISVNLLPYLGSNITIIFESGDCALSGHLGYSYVDLKCQPNKLLAQSTYICKGVDAVLSAPDGMDGYEWHYGDSLGPIVGTTPTITVSDTGFYYCTLTPFSSAANSCPFTLPIYVEPAPSDPVADYTWEPNPACIDQNIQFTDESTTEDDSPLVFWQWNFDDGSPVSNVQNPTHSYSAAGNYNVELVIESVDGCRDTISQVVIVIPLTDPVITPPELICSEDEPFDLSGTPADGIWSGVGIIDTVKGTFDPKLAYATQASPYTIRYVAGQCGEFTTIDLEIVRQQHASYPLVGPFCNDDNKVRLRPTEPKGVWSGTGIDSTGVFDPATAVIGDNDVTYGFYDDCGADTTQTIIVNARKDATITPIADVCLLSDPVQLEVAEEGGIWTGDGVNATGVFDPGAAGIGSHELIYTHTEPCPDADTITINVIENKDPDFDKFGPLCESADSVIIIPLETGGTWSGNGVDAQGVFRPSVAGVGKHVISYRFGEQCGGAHAEQIEVLKQANASITGPAVMCPKDAPVQIRPTQGGGTWSGTGVSSTGKFDPANAPTNQNITITYIIAGPCPDTGYHTIFIKDLFNSTITPVGPYCADDAIVTLSAVDGGGNWTGNGIANSTAGTFDPKIAGIGTHTITYTIPGNCGTTSTTTIEVRRRPDPSMTPVLPQCFNGAPVGVITLEKGGIWSGAVDNNGFFDPKSNGPGTHRVYYSFTGLCTSIDSIDIIVTEPIAISDSIVDVTCKDYTDGKIYTTATGGWDQAPYAYAWSPDQTSNTQPNFIGIGAGVYKVRVTDLYGCVDSLNITVNEPDSILFTTVVDSSSCSQANGRAEVTSVSGGTPPYNYAWQNSVVTPINNNIVAGPYKIDVSDSQQCIKKDTVYVFDRPGTVFDIVTNPTSCFGGSDGTAEVQNIGGGTAPFTIVWSTGLFNGNANHGNLAAAQGVYSVTVTDATGCALTKGFDIVQPTPVDVSLPGDSTLCFAQTINITATATGGTPGYKYFWNGNGPVGNSMIVSQATKIDVYATDINNCVSDTETVNINYLPPLQLDALPNETIICAGESIDLYSIYLGGNGQYNFLWDDGVTTDARNFTPPGQYGDTVTIGLTLSDNCSPDVYDAVQIVFFEPAQPAFNAMPTEGCFPLIVNFEDLSTNVASYFWTLGDGTNNENPGNFTHIYDKGVYDVTLHAISPDGCEAYIAKTEYIKSYGNPVADFTWQPKPITLVSDEIQFLDRSLGDISTWSWEFYELDTTSIVNSNDRNPIVNSPGAIGNYLAYLHVTTINNCTDSVWKVWEIEPDFTVYVPNSFSPNGDGVNEGFRPIVRGVRVESFEFEIFDRWGERVWFSTDQNEVWDGNLRTNPYEKLKTDVYVWHLRLRDFRGIKHKYFGHVTLLK